MAVQWKSKSVRILLWEEVRCLMFRFRSHLVRAKCWVSSGPVRSKQGEFWSSQVYPRVGSGLARSIPA